MKLKKKLKAEEIEKKKVLSNWLDRLKFYCVYTLKHFNEWSTVCWKQNFHLYGQKMLTQKILGVLDFISEANKNTGLGNMSYIQNK